MGETTLPCIVIINESFFGLEGTVERGHRIEQTTLTRRTVADLSRWFESLVELAQALSEAVSVAGLRRLHG